jgi:hypothetical protein
VTCCASRNKGPSSMIIKCYSKVDTLFNSTRSSQSTLDNVKQEARGARALL